VRSCRRLCRGKTISITYSECASVDLLIQHAARMRLVYCHLGPALLYIIPPRYLINPHDSRRYGAEQKKKVCEWRHLDVFKFNTRIIKYLSSNTFSRQSKPVWIVNLVEIPTCNQHLLTWFANRPDDGHVRTETCSLTHNKAW